MVRWLLREGAEICGIEELINEEWERREELVERGYGVALEKLRVKRGRYGIDCRVVPDNQLLCEDLDNEVFFLLHGALVSPSITKAIFSHLGVFNGVVRH